MRHDCSLPYLAKLPAGIFIYWVTSGTFTALQRQVFRSKTVHRLLGLRNPALAHKRAELTKKAAPTA